MPAPQRMEQPVPGHVQAKAGYTPSSLSPVTVKPSQRHKGSLCSGSGVESDDLNASFSNSVVPKTGIETDC